MRLSSTSSVSSFHPVRRWFYWQPVLFCFLFLVLAAGAIGFFLHDLAERANKDAENTARLLVTTAIGVLDEDLSGRMVDYAWWNDMHDQVTGDLDPDWADDNIGSYLQDSFSYAGTYALSAGGEVIFSSLGSEVLPETPSQLLGESADVFLAQVQDSPMDASIPRTTIAVRDGMTFLVAAAPVTPEDPTGEQLARHTRPVLFFLRELNDAVMARIADSYGVLNPRLVLENAERGVPLTDATGAVVARIIWDPLHPGDSMMVELLPKLALVFVLLLIAASTIYFLWIKAALSASEAKSQLLAKMSHELRTPLNPILGFSQMMIGETVGPVAPIYRGYAQDIHNSASHLRNVIDGLLDFSKMEAGKVVLREDPLDIDSLIDSALHIVSPIGRAEAAGLTGAIPEIRQEIADGLPRIRGDELRLRQVLINVLSNAVKFSDGNPIDIRALRHGANVQIAVEDHGIGISKDDLQTLFEPFVQATPRRDSSPTPGTGLGLVIARELMRLHGGTLDLKSTLGEGTTVTLTFPAGRILG